MLGTPPNSQLQTPRLSLADFPAIAELKMTDSEFETLATQGFVCQERRYHRLYYKLRFRFHGKQRVRYIRSKALAEAVNAELRVLQQDLRLRSDIAALTKAASQHLRAAKASLAAYLEVHGYHFHGQSIRKRRATTALSLAKEVRANPEINWNDN